jgi:Ser/Thr protein kinase RdoA (MazF antagonist)
MHSPGQSDRVYRIASELRAKDARLSLVEAIAKAQEEVAQETAAVRALACKAVRVAPSARTLNDTQVDLLCRGEMSLLARDARIREIERQHRGAR